MAKPTDVDCANIYYGCPDTDTGYFDLPKEYKILRRNNPKRVEFVFTCGACENKHIIVFQESNG